MNPMAECDSCGKVRADVIERPGQGLQCLPCWQSALEHGHRHGLHQDADGCDVRVADCPRCAQLGSFVVSGRTATAADPIVWQWIVLAPSGSEAIRRAREELGGLLAAQHWTVEPAPLQADRDECLTETTTRAYHVRAVQLEAGTPDRPGPWEETRVYQASALGEALTMAEQEDAGREAENGGGAYTYGIRPEDYATADAEGIYYNTADGLLLEGSTCGYCGNSGHYAYDCPEKPEED